MTTTKLVLQNEYKNLLEKVEHIPEKIYTDIVRKNNAYTNDILVALSIVANFIKSNKHIIVGGQAIDFALRLKGTNLYDDDTIPDYDIVSPNFHLDAYKLANILLTKGISMVSVINALHPSTMKVRVKFVTVCDITYVPHNLYKILPTLNYNGFSIIHPSYQFIDQHRSLSHPYEGAPYITILHRLEKDMKRYDLLYSYYPFSNVLQDNPENECGCLAPPKPKLIKSKDKTKKSINPATVQESIQIEGDMSVTPQQRHNTLSSELAADSGRDQPPSSMELIVQAGGLRPPYPPRGAQAEHLFKMETYQISTKLLDNCCLNGYIALMYWVDLAYKKGFKSSLGIPHNILTACKFNEQQIECLSPIWLYGVTIYTDIIFDVVERIQKHFPDMSGDAPLFSHKYKNAVLDKVRRKVLMKHNISSKTTVEHKSATKNSYKWEIFDTKGIMVSAHKPWSDVNLFIGNIQLIMTYSVTYYWLFSCKWRFRSKTGRMPGIPSQYRREPHNQSLPTVRGGQSPIHEKIYSQEKLKRIGYKAEIYKLIYLLCRELIAWAAKGYINDPSNKEFYKLFLPTEKTYGAYNWSDRYRLSRERFKVVLQEAKSPPYKVLPKSIHPRDRAFVDLNDETLAFDPNKSEFFQFDGKTTEQFQPIILAQ